MWKSLILLTITVCVLAACASTVSVESKKDQDYTKVLDRLYLVVDTGESNLSDGTISSSHILGDYLVDSMQKKLAAAGIETKGKRLTGLELSKDELQNAMKGFGASVAMLVGLSEGYVNQQKELVSAVFDFTIVDTELGRTVWRAKAKFDAPKAMAGNYIGSISSDDVDKIIADTITAMRSDGLIFRAIDNK